MADINFSFNTDMKSAKNGMDFYEKLFELHHDYNAYIQLLHRAKQQLLELNQYNDGSNNVADRLRTEEDARERTNELKNEADPEFCFKRQREFFLPTFKEGECLTGTLLNSLLEANERIFLLPNKDMLLTIRSGQDWEIPFEQYYIHACLLEIGKHCIGRSFIGQIERSNREDGDYCEDSPAFKFFSKDGDETPEYRLTDELARYDGVDIRDILTPMSFEEIAERLKVAKEKEEEKRFTLLRQTLK